MGDVAKKVEALEKEVSSLRSGLAECNESIRELHTTVAQNQETVMSKLQELVQFQRQQLEWQQNVQRAQQSNAGARSMSEVNQVAVALPDPPMQHQGRSEHEGMPKAFMRQMVNQIPSVNITNSGSVEVNGQYLLNGYCDGKPQYHMHEQDTIFEIFWFPKYKSWMIYRTDAKPNVKYYMAKVDSPKPPDFKWIVLAHGKEPAPKLEGGVFKKSMVGGTQRSMSLADGKAPGRRSNKKMSNERRNTFSGTKSSRKNMPVKLITEHTHAELANANGRARSVSPAVTTRAERGGGLDSSMFPSREAGTATPTTSVAEKGTKTTTTPRSRSLDRSGHRRADSDVDYIKQLGLL